MAAHEVVMVTGCDKVHSTRDQDGGGETQRDTARRKRKRIYIFGQ